MSVSKKPKVVVIGIGNLLMQDDSIGVRAVHSLRQLKLPENINLEIIDGGNAPDLSVFIDCVVDKLVIIDAVQANGVPGTIYRFTADSIDEGYDFASGHDLSIRQSLAMMQLTGNKPIETVIIGVEPEKIGGGDKLTPKLEQTLPEIVKLVLKEIRS
jgi:hydrogenase maturation protease